MPRPIRPPEPLAMPTYALSLLGRQARARMADTLPDGLRLGHLAVLGALAEQASQSQRALGQTLAIHTTDLVAIIDDLVARDLARREVDPDDRRRRLVQITFAGRRQVARSTTDSQQLIEELLVPLAPTQRATVARLLSAALRADRG